MVRSMKYAAAPPEGAQCVEEVYIEGLPSGGGDGGYELPAATPSALGGVKQAAFVDDPASDSPTKAEFVALRDALVASGAMAAS